MELSEKCLLPLFLSGDQPSSEGASLVINAEINAQKCALISLVASIVDSYDRIKRRCSGGTSGSSSSSSSSSSSGGDSRSSSDICRGSSSSSSSSSSSNSSIGGSSTTSSSSVTSSSSSSSNSSGGTSTSTSKGVGNEVVDLLFLVDWSPGYFFAVCDVLVVVYSYIHDKHLKDLEVRLTMCLIYMYCMYACM